MTSDHSQSLEEEKREETITVKKLEVEFIRDFLNYLNKIRRHTKGSGTIKQKCKMLYESHTVPFYKKWSKYKGLSHYFDNNTVFGYKFFSFGLSFDQSIMLIPHRIISQMNITGDVGLKNILGARTVQDFCIRLWKVYSADNLPLNYNDIKIIRYYVSPEFYQDRKRFPSEIELAQEIECDQRTIIKRTAKLYDLYILSHTYLIDFANLGYSTRAYLFNTNNNKIFEEISDYCLSTFPLQFGLDQGFLKIFKIPNWKHEIFQIISQEANAINEFQLKEEYLGWNMNQLTPNNQSRWQNLPPILFENNWEEKIIVDRQGISKDLTPAFEAPPINRSHAKLLTYYQKHGTTFDKEISEAIGLNQKTVKNLWKDIIKFKLTIPFSFIRNVGLEIPLYIVAVKKTEKNNSCKMTQIRDHLCHFPFVRVLFSEKILIGKILLPSAWFRYFVTSWKRLAELGYITRYETMDEQIRIKRNLNIVETFF